jgi:hypothetical protein
MAQGGLAILRWEKEYQGYGTENSPYLIKSASELAGLNSYLGEENKNAHFILASDIDLESYPTESEGWRPIGRLETDGTYSQSFQAKFDGRNFRITGLWINSPSTYLGLFGSLFSAQIENLYVQTNSDGIVASNTTEVHAGILAGTMGSPNTVGTDTIINNVKVAGNINGGMGSLHNFGGIAGSLSFTQISNSGSDVVVRDSDLVGTSRIGGVAGYMVQGNKITETFGSLEATAKANMVYIGGFAGAADTNNTVSGSYAIVDISVPVATSGSFIGGFIGLLTTNDTISDSYSAGRILVEDIATTDSPSIGGFVGMTASVAFTNTYASVEMTMPGTVGNNFGGYAGNFITATTLVGAYYDKDLAKTDKGVGSGTVSGVTGLNTSAMSTKANFSGFDFTENTGLWKLTGDRPQLAWEEALSSGIGTESNPYIIRTPDDVDALRKYIGAHNDGKYFKFTNNINLTNFTNLAYSSDGWSPIGSDPTDGEGDFFYGTVDGNGYAITGLKLQNASEFGLFGGLSNAEIKNLTIKDAVVEIVDGGYTVGGILAATAQSTVISNVNASGKMTIVSATQIVGGMVGSGTDMSVSDSGVDINYTATASDELVFGGFVGASSGGSYQRSYTNVVAVIDADLSAIFGGFV